MDLDQLNKKLEWLDDERRKDKTTIAMLSERLSILEGSLSNNKLEINNLQNETSRISSSSGKIDQIQSTVSKLKVDLSKSLESNDKIRDEKIRDADKVHKSELAEINKSISELRKNLETITEIKKTLQVRQEEEFRISRLIGDIDKRIVDFSRKDEENSRTMRLLDEGRRNDSKRLTDLLGEVNAIRKRQDELRVKVDLSVDSSRKMDLRVNDLVSAETERRQVVNSFIEKQNIQQLDRDKIWKEWQERFASFDKQTSILEQQILALESLQRSVKRSQDALDENTQKIDRRINEITEVSRINEDRFRQEWGSFKTDDQKRWTNYSLNQEEQLREHSRQFDSYKDRLTKQEDLSQDLNDLLTAVNDETTKRIQNLISLTHSWAADLNNITKTNG